MSEHPVRSIATTRQHRSMPGYRHCGQVSLRRPSKRIAAPSVNMFEMAVADRMRCGDAELVLKWSGRPICLWTRSASSVVLISRVHAEPRLQRAVARGKLAVVHTLTRLQIHTQHPQGHSSTDLVGIPHTCSPRNMGQAARYSFVSEEDQT